MDKEEVLKTTIDGTYDPNRIITFPNDLEQRALKFIQENKKTFEALK